LDDPALDAAKKREILTSRLLPSAAAIRLQAGRIIGMNLADLEAGRGAAHQMAERAARAMHWLAVLGIGVAAAIVLLAGSVVLRPIKELERSAREIAGGNLDMKVPVRTRDEIGRLGETFNHMAAQLRQFKRSDQQKLLRIQHTTQLAIDSLPDAVIIIDPRGRTELANVTAQRLFALRPEMSVIDDMPSPWLADLHTQAIAQAKPQRPAGYISAIRIDDEGETRYFLPRAFPIFDDSDRRDVIGSAIILADVTELRRLDEVKNSLLSTTAHELKTPLTSMRMAAHLIAEERIGPLNDRQRRLFAAASEDCDRLHEIVESLLDMERIRLGKLHMETRAENGGELAREAAESNCVAAESRGVKLDVDLPDGGEWSVRVDRQRIGLVFDNLIGNALKYTPAGGTIRVGAVRDRAGGHFFVTDTGRGIPDSLKHRVFEKFFRAPGQSSDTGSGLGLSIVKEIVEAHGGRVWAESREGQGTTVHFVLPLTDQSQPAQSQEPKHDHAREPTPIA
jgi:two-component system, NtrC family, sensor histidine kinase KinB